MDPSSLISEHASIFLEKKFAIDPRLLRKYLTKIDKACSELNEEKVIRILEEMPIEYSRETDFDTSLFKSKRSGKTSQKLNTKEFRKHATT